MQLINSNFHGNCACGDCRLEGSCIIKTESTNNLPEPVGSGTSSLFRTPLWLVLAAVAAAFEVLLLVALEVSASWGFRLCEELGPAAS